MTMSDTPREIELEVEVPGTPEQVWQAIATGPGITSWYVPHTVQERAGGAARASFGSGPEMQVDGRVAVWEPPHRVVFDGGEGVQGLAFEWLVEARDGGSCVVRLVNTGFGDGGEWDSQYDAMREGWGLFLLNLRLHLEHFAGQEATPALPAGGWASDAESAWRTLTEALSIPSVPSVGDRLVVDPGAGAALSGRVVAAAPRRVGLLVDRPAPGTAFVAAEHQGAGAAVSVWAYFYGPDRQRVAAEHEAAWQRWLAAQAPRGPGGLPA